MKKTVVFMLLVTVLLGCTPQESGDPALLTPQAGDGAAQETTFIEPTGEQIAAVEKEMAGWADGRWTEHTATWSPESGTFTLSATAGPGADETAIKGYCRILDEIASKHVPDVKVAAAVYFPSGAKIQCK